MYVFCILSNNVGIPALPNGRTYVLLARVAYDKIVRPPERTDAGQTASFIMTRLCLFDFRCREKNAPKEKSNPVVLAVTETSFSAPRQRGEEWGKR